MAAYLQITLHTSAANRPAAACIYHEFRTLFLNTIVGAKSKELLVRDEDVQVLHGFDSKENAQAYLQSELFTANVVARLQPLLGTDPEVRIYAAA